jgi:UMF1 family MFS transporter
MEMSLKINFSNEHRWIVYDWANSVFAVSVMSGFFPLLFRKYWASNLESEEITLHLGLTNSLLSLSLFFLLPFLGYLLDHKIKSPQRLLFTTACLGALFTSTLFFVDQGEHFQALILYGFSFLFFALGNTQ